MVGPTAQDVESKVDTGSTAPGLDQLRVAARRIMPDLAEHEVTAVYVGLRAATEHSDYQLQSHDDIGYVCAAGIRSTGLTASMAIAEWVRDALDGAGLHLRERPQGLPGVRMPNIGEAFPRPYAHPEAIAADAAYGEVVCFCERVTRGEIRDAAQSTLPPADLDGLRRRTRVLMGRCQGFFCGAQVAQVFGDYSDRDRAQLWELTQP
jgi:glycerol-3-phosphate dehydrogenase